MRAVVFVLSDPARDAQFGEVLKFVGPLPPVPRYDETDRGCCCPRDEHRPCTGAQVETPKTETFPKKTGVRYVAPIKDGRNGSSRGTNGANPRVLNTNVGLLHNKSHWFVRVGSEQPNSFSTSWCMRAIRTAAAMNALSVSFCRCAAKKMTSRSIGLLK
jgi:hypothetical protein